MDMLRNGDTRSTRRLKGSRILGPVAVILVFLCAGLTSIGCDEAEPASPLAGTFEGACDQGRCDAGLECSGGRCAWEDSVAGRRAQKKAANAAARRTRDAKISWTEQVWKWFGKIVVILLIVLVVVGPFVAFFSSARKRARDEKTALAEVPDAERESVLQESRAKVRRKGLFLTLVGFLIFLVGGVSLSMANEEGGMIWTGGLLLGFAMTVSGLFKMLSGRDL